MNRSIKTVAMPAGTVAVLLVIWEAFVRITQTPLYVLPAPSKVVTTLLSERAALWSHSLTTLKETVLGLVIAVILALVISVLMDAFSNVKAAIYPILVASQTIPVIVLAPVFIIYLGFGMAPKILTVVLMCFFPIVVSLTDGLVQVDPNQINLLRSYGAGWGQVYWIVKLPAAAPALFSGLKMSATYSITGAVVGEWLSSDSGLGYYMLRVKNGFMLDKVFACILVVALLSLMLNGIVKLMAFLLFPHLRKGREA